MKVIIEKGWCVNAAGDTIYSRHRSYFGANDKPHRVILLPLEEYRRLKRIEQSLAECRKRQLSKEQP